MYLSVKRGGKRGKRGQGAQQDVALVRMQIAAQERNRRWHHFLCEKREGLLVRMRQQGTSPAAAFVTQVARADESGAPRSGENLAGQDDSVGETGMTDLAEAGDLPTVGYQSAWWEEGEGGQHGTAHDEGAGSGWGVGEWERDG